MLLDLVDIARRQIIERERAVAGADQAADLEAEKLQHAADLPVLAFAQLHFHPAVAARAPFQIGVDRSVANAFDLDPVDQFFQLLLADIAEHACAVSALDAGGGQFELAFQPAVRRHQQQAFGVEIEPPDRHEPRQPFGQLVVDGRPALGIAFGGQQPGGLVIAEQAGGGGGLDRIAVDGHARQRGEDGGGRFDRDAVDRDPAFRDHPFDLAAGCDAGARQQLGDALRIARLFLHRPIRFAVRTHGGRRGGGTVRAGGTGRAGGGRGVGAAGGTQRRGHPIWACSGGRK